MIKIIKETHEYKNNWGKIVKSELKYKYENVNSKLHGECISYKLSEEELEKELKRIYRGK